MENANIGRVTRETAKWVKTFLAWLFLGACCASAQPYSIDWFTIDGGGGTSSGGGYSLSGTIGQPDAGTMSGGSFTLVGGFWSIEVIQTPGAPLLTVARNLTTGAVTVSWTRPAQGWVLDETANMAAPPMAISWSPVSAASYQTNATHISVTIPAPAGNRYYRLRR